MSQFFDTPVCPSVLDHISPITVTPQRMLSAALDTVAQHIGDGNPASVLVEYDYAGELKSATDLSLSEGGAVVLTECLSGMSERGADMWFVILYSRFEFETGAVDLGPELHSCMIMVSHVNEEFDEGFSLIGLIRGGAFVSLASGTHLATCAEGSSERAN